MLTCTGVPPAARPAASGRSGGRGIGRGSSGNGTGYGGSHCLSWGAKQEANPGAAQAAVRQQGVDKDMTAQLSDIRNLLSQVCSTLCLSLTSPS